MNYFNLIVESILREGAVLSNVIDAVKKRYEVDINYKADDEPKGLGKRIIQPVCIGKTKSGNLAVRAFQPYGDTKSDVPRWKLFRLDRIQQWKPVKKRRFKAPEGFNPNGDDGMSEVLYISDFTGKGYKGSGLEQYNNERTARKMKENPYYGLKRNMVKSFNGNNIDYIKKNIEDWQKSQAAKDFKKGNGQSVYDMSKSRGFGNDDNTSTIGPIEKNGGQDVNKQVQTQNDYTTAYANGPIYTDDTKNLKDNNVKDFTYGDNNDYSLEDKDEEINF